MKRLSKPIKISLALVALIVLGVIATGLYTYYRTTQVDWSRTKDVFDVLKNFATIVALGAGAVWAYFNFFKGRTYRSRLEPKVSGKLITRNRSNYLIVTAQLKNVGLSDVRVDQEGSALRIFAYAVGEYTSKARSVEQSRLITLPVFEDHGWIEPGELIEDQRLVAIPDVEYVALQIGLRLVSNKIEWNSAAIIEPPQLGTSSANQSQLEGGAPISLEAKCAGLLEGEKPTHEMVSGTEDLANISMQQKEDPEKSRRIEEEKKPTEIIDVEKPMPDKEEAREVQPRQELPHEAK